jgi:hypothetical protein
MRGREGQPNQNASERTSRRAAFSCAQNPTPQSRRGTVVSLVINVHEHTPIFVSFPA